MRDKHTQKRPSTPLARNEADQSNRTNASSSEERPVNAIPDVNSLNQNPFPDPILSSSSWFDDGLCGYFSEEEIQEILMKSMDSLYNEVIDKLVASGYDEDLALNAVLKSGHFYGEMDVFTNIFDNAMACLNGVGSFEGNVADLECAYFSNLTRMEQYSLAGMLSLLRRVSPNMSGVHPGGANATKPPVSQSSAGSGCDSGLVGGNGGVAPTGSSLKGDGAASKLICVEEEESLSKKDQDALNSVMNTFQNLNLDENTLDQKDEMILRLINEIKNSEKQLAERKKWAVQTVTQSARKLSYGLIELQTMRSKREEAHKKKNEKPTIESSTMKMLSELENALGKASDRVNHSNAAVAKLETENAEIRAEMEASKLRASESLDACIEIEKKEKKFLKKLSAVEKQNSVMEEDCAAETQKISDLQKELALIDVAVKDAEENWRQERKRKELAVELMEQGRLLKEASDSNHKVKMEYLRTKLSTESQRHEDDLQRIKQDYEQLKESSQIKEEDPWDMQTDSSLDKGYVEKAIGFNRKCKICGDEEAYIVFLPCAHQVLCGSCCDKYYHIDGRLCPECFFPIAHKIRIYGA